MKINKRQLKRIIREEKRKLTENTDAEGKLYPTHQQLYTMLADIAIHFLMKDQNDTGAEIYDELMIRIDAEGLSQDIDQMLEEI